MTPSSDLRLYKLYLSILPTCTANDIFSNPTWINAIIGDDNVANFLYVINIAKIVSRPFFIVQLPEEVVALVPCRLKIFLVSDPRSTGIRVRDNHRLFGAKSRML
jgi:hypothetical protein